MTGVGLGKGLEAKIVSGMGLRMGVKLGLGVGLAWELALHMGVGIRVGGVISTHLPQIFQSPSWPPLAVTHV